MVHEGEASGQGEESPAEGAHARHSGDGQQPRSTSAELGRDGVHNAAERPSLTGVSGDRRTTRSEKESSAMSSAAAAIFATGRPQEKGGGGEVLCSVSQANGP